MGHIPLAEVDVTSRPRRMAAIHRRCRGYSKEIVPIRSSGEELKVVKALLGPGDTNLPPPKDGAQA